MDDPITSATDYTIGQLNSLGVVGLFIALTIGILAGIIWWLLARHIPTTRSDDRETILRLLDRIEGLESELATWQDRAFDDKRDLVEISVASEKRLADMITLLRSKG